MVALFVVALVATLLELYSDFTTLGSYWQPGCLLWHLESGFILEDSHPRCDSGANEVK